MMKMVKAKGGVRRVLLDTNIYGLLVIDIDRLKMVNSIQSSELIIVYGNELIRKELRRTPKESVMNGKSFRISLLNLFDGLVGNHIYDITQETRDIAEKYYKAYRTLGGSKSKLKIIDDFIIIASATLHDLDIVVSEDKMSMLKESSLGAYELVNSILKKRTPDFIDYRKFRRWFV